jgi:hypothetical protein
METMGSGDILLVSAFAGFEGLFSYSAVLPSIMTIGTFVDSQEKIRMIRQGEIVGTVLNLAFGIALSMFSGSFLPLAFTIGACAVMIGIYEYALRSAPAWNKDN